MARRPLIFKELGIVISRNAGNGVIENMKNCMDSLENIVKEKVISRTGNYVERNMAEEMISDFISQDSALYQGRDVLEKRDEKLKQYEEVFKKLASQQNQLLYLSNFFRDFCTNLINGNTYGSCEVLKEQLQPELNEINKDIEDKQHNIDFCREKIAYLKSHNNFKESYFKNCIDLLIKLFENTIESREIEIEFIRSNLKYVQNCIADVEKLAKREKILSPEDFNAELVRLKYQINFGFSELYSASGMVNRYTYTEDNSCYYVDGIKQSNGNMHKPNYLHYKLGPHQDWVETRCNLRKYIYGKLADEYSNDEDVYIEDNEDIACSSNFYKNKFGEIRSKIDTDSYEPKYKKLNLNKLKNALDNILIINKNINKTLREVMTGSNNITLAYIDSQTNVLSQYSLTHNKDDVSNYLEKLIKVFGDCENEFNVRQARNNIDATAAECKEISEKYYISKSLWNIIDSINKIDQNFDNISANGKKIYSQIANGNN